MDLSSGLVEVQTHWRGVCVASRDDIERVRDATDLVALIGEHVPLQPRGREHVGLCPFHEDRRPSFAVVTHKAAAFYKCHACGAAGDCFRFVQEHLGKDFGEALRFLAERAGIELQNSGHDGEADQRAARKTWLRKAMHAANTHFQANLQDAELGDAARAAIAARGISADMVDRFSLGAAGPGWSTLRDAVESDDMPNKVLVAAGLLKQREDGHTWDTFRNRLMFPIMDETGQPIAFGGRILDADDTPKYLNSAEHDLFHKSRTLFGLHLARKAIMQSGQAIITEGYTDVIACHQAGIENVVGTLGTALTTDHTRHLARLCDVVTLLFDGDEAGRRAAERAIPLMLEHAIDVRICVLPRGADPDDLLHAENGPARFTEAVNAAVDGFEYLLDRLAADVAEADSLSGRQRVLEAFFRTISARGIDRLPRLRRAMVIGRLAELAGVAPAVIADMLDRSGPAVTEQPEAGASLLPEPGADEGATRALRRAEMDLLAIAIFTQRPDCAPTPADCEAMADPIASRIAAAVERLAREETDITVQRLMSTLDAADDRTCASDLYFDGERLVETFGGSIDAAVEHCRTTLNRCRKELDSRRRMTDWKATAASDPQEAAAMIDHLRGMGPRAAAMPRAASS